MSGSELGGRQDCGPAPVDENPMRPPLGASSVAYGGNDGPPISAGSDEKAQRRVEEAELEYHYKKDIDGVEDSPRDVSTGFNTGTRKAWYEELGSPHSPEVELRKKIAAARGKTMAGTIEARYEEFGSPHSPEIERRKKTAAVRGKTMAGTSEARHEELGSPHSPEIERKKENAAVAKGKTTAGTVRRRGRSPPPPPVSDSVAKKTIGLPGEVTNNDDNNRAKEEKGNHRYVPLSPRSARRKKLPSILRSGSVTRSIVKESEDEEDVTPHAPVCPPLPMSATHSVGSSVSGAESQVFDHPWAKHVTKDQRIRLQLLHAQAQRQKKTNQSRGSLWSQCLTGTTEKEDRLPWSQCLNRNEKNDSDSDTIFEFDDDGNVDPLANFSIAGRRIQGMTNNESASLDLHARTQRAWKKRRSTGKKTRMNLGDTVGGSSGVTSKQQQQKSKSTQKDNGTPESLNQQRSQSAPRHVRPRGRSNSPSPAAVSTTRGSVQFKGETVIHSYSRASDDERKGAFSDDESFYSKMSEDHNLSDDDLENVRDIMKDLFFIGRGSRFLHRDKVRVEQSIDERESVEESSPPRSISLFEKEEQGMPSSRKKKKSDVMRQIEDDSYSVDSKAQKEKNSNETDKEREEDMFSSVWELVQEAKNALSTDQIVEDAKNALNSGLMTTLGTDQIVEDAKNALSTGLMTAASFIPSIFTEDTKEKSKDEKVIVDRSTKGKVGHKNKQISGHHTNGSANNNVFNELLLCAAQSRHQANGVIFDKTSSIDVVADIKFVKVAIAMPLGLIFQDNVAGCYVSCILPDGNAVQANSDGDKIEVGDQLAAINGISAINVKGNEKMSVSAICEAIKSAPDRDEIQMVFLRYVGPLHSALGIRVAQSSNEKEGPTPATSKSGLKDGDDDSTKISEKKKLNTALSLMEIERSSSIGSRSTYKSNGSYEDSITKSNEGEDNVAKNNKESLPPPQRHEVMRLANDVKLVSGVSDLDSLSKITKPDKGDSCVDKDSDTRKKKTFALVKTLSKKNFSVFRKGKK